MSAEAHAQSESRDHAHHILPLKVYFGVFSALLVLTFITVAVAQIDLGPLNLLVAMLVAGVKASLVALYFMHLRYDNKLYAVIFVCSLLFLAAFIIFTMFDTMSRDAISPEEGGPIVPQAEMYSQPAAVDNTQGADGTEGGEAVAGAEEGTGESGAAVDGEAEHEGDAADH